MKNKIKKEEGITNSFSNYNYSIINFSRNSYINVKWRKWNIKPSSKS